jgi:hypothetical protein
LVSNENSVMKTARRAKITRVIKRAIPRCEVVLEGEGGDTGR